MEVTGAPTLGAPDARTYAIIGVASAFLGLSWITVTLRVFARGYIIRSFGWDDWLMIVTLAFFTLEAAILVTIVLIQINEGLTELRWISKTVTCLVLEFAFYILTMLFLKLSFAIFFLRVVIAKWQRWIVYVSVAIYTVYTFGFLFVAIFQCGNPAQFIVHHLQGKCIPWSVLGPMNYLHAALNATTDWILAILPIFVIRKTKMPRQAKISVCMILALGALASVASLVRLAYIPGLDPNTDNYFPKAISIGVASIIEPGLGIIAGSLATLRPLLQLVLEKSRTGWASSNPEDQSESPTGRKNVIVAGDKQRGNIAPHGFSADFEKGDSTCVGTETGNSHSIPPEHLMMESTPDKVEGPLPCRMASERHSLGWLTISYMTKPSRASMYAEPTTPYSRSRMPSETFSWLSPRTAFSRAASLASARKSSQAMTHESPSEESLESGTRKETWDSLDLEAMRRDWHYRARDSRGDARIEPDLLLPDPDLEDEYPRVNI